MYSLNNFLNGLEVSSMMLRDALWYLKGTRGFGFRMDLVLHIDDKDVDRKSVV